MGTYHTFFVANDRLLDRLFPGWMRVRPEQSTVEATNPFTKKKQTIRRWEPVAPPTPLGKPNLYDDSWGPAIESQVQPNGEFADYQRGIEKAGAPGLRAVPHFRAKNVDVFYEFDALVKLLHGDDRSAPPARLGAQGDDDVPCVFRLPRDSARKMLSLDDASLRELVTRLLSESGHAGTEAQTNFIAYVMRPLVALCRIADASDGEVCHYYALHH